MVCATFSLHCTWQPQSRTLCPSYLTQHPISSSAPRDCMGHWESLVRTNCQQFFGSCLVLTILQVWPTLIWCLGCSLTPLGKSNWCNCLVKSGSPTNTKVGWATWLFFVKLPPLSLLPADHFILAVALEHFDNCSRPSLRSPHMSVQIPITCQYKYQYKQCSPGCYYKSPLTIRASGGDLAVLWANGEVGKLGKLGNLSASRLGKEEGARDQLQLAGKQLSVWRSPPPTTANWSPPPPTTCQLPTGTTKDALTTLFFSAVLIFCHLWWNCISTETEVVGGFERGSRNLERGGRSFQRGSSNLERCGRRGKEIKWT